MLVQCPQHSSGIGTAAAHTGFHGNPLQNTDFQTVGVFFDGIEKYFGSLPGQIPFIAGNALHAALQAPGLAGSDIDFYIVTDGYGLHDALQVMVAVLPLAQNIQRQIQLGESAFIKSGHSKYILPVSF